MTADATPAYFPSMPPTFGWRRVVELADEFKVSTADMLAICDRLGVVVEDASEWLAPDTVDLIRDVVAVGGSAALLQPPTPPAPPKSKAEKLPGPEKVPKVPRAVKVTTPHRGSEPPALASVSRDGVRTRRVVLIGLVIALLAAGTGVLTDRWVEYVTSTETPATVVTSGER